MGSVARAAALCCCAVLVAAVDAETPTECPADGSGGPECASDACPELRFATGSGYNGKCSGEAHQCTAAFGGSRSSCADTCASAGLDCVEGYDDTSDAGCPPSTALGCTRPLHTRVCSCTRRSCKGDSGCSKGKACVEGFCRDKQEGRECKADTDCGGAYPLCLVGRCGPRAEAEPEPEPDPVLPPYAQVFGNMTARREEIEALAERRGLFNLYGTPMIELVHMAENDVPQKGRIPRFKWEDPEDRDLIAFGIDFLRVPIIVELPSNLNCTTNLAWFKKKLIKKRPVRASFQRVDKIHYIGKSKPAGLEKDIDDQMPQWENIPMKQYNKRIKDNQGKFESTYGTVTFDKGTHPCLPFQPQLERSFFTGAGWTNQERSVVNKRRSWTLRFGWGRQIYTAHYDVADNFLAMFQGSKRVLMAPQSQFGNFYIHQDGGTHHRRQHPLIDWYKPDTEKWPLIQQARALHCVLRPGDVLFLPAAWIHYLEHEGPPGGDGHWIAANYFGLRQDNGESSDPGGRWWSGYEKGQWRRRPLTKLS